MKKKAKRLFAFIVLGCVGVCVGKLLQNDNGEYVAHLTLNDGSKTLLTLDIPSPEKSLAKSLVSSWPRCAGEIYQDLMRAFSEAQEDK